METIERIEDGNGQQSDLTSQDIDRWAMDINHYMPRGDIGWDIDEIKAVIRGAIGHRLSPLLRAKVEAYIAA